MKLETVISRLNHNLESIINRAEFKLDQIEILREWTESICSKELDSEELDELYLNLIGNISTSEPVQALAEPVQAKEELLTEAEAISLIRKERLKNLVKCRLQRDIKDLLGYI